MILLKKVKASPYHTCVGCYFASMDCDGLSCVENIYKKINFKRIKLKGNKKLRIFKKVEDKELWGCSNCDSFILESYHNDYKCLLKCLDENMKCYVFKNLKYKRVK